MIACQGICVPLLALVVLSLLKLHLLVNSSTESLSRARGHTHMRQAGSRIACALFRYAFFILIGLNCEGKNTYIIYGARVLVKLMLILTIYRNFQRACNDLPGRARAL